MKPSGGALVGYRVAIWWDGDDKWFSGVVKSFSRFRGHTVLYDDGELKTHKLDNEDEEDEWEEWTVETAPVQTKGGAKRKR